MKAMASDINRRYASAEEMIADLESFRKDPSVSLDFELSDLRGEDADEPTQPLRGPVSRAVTNPPRQRTAPAPERERRREYEEEPAHKKSRTQTVLIAVAAVLAVALAVTLFRSILGSFNRPADQYVVRSVLGMTVEEAQQMEGIRDVFELKVMEESIFSEEYPIPGTIARQSPEPETNKKGELPITLQVWLSAGKDMGEMIDVVTTPYTLAQAKTALKALVDQYDLILEEPTEESQVFHDEVETGYVVATIPAAGEPLEKGDTIRFIVSKGKEIKPVTVRNYVGLTLEKARQLVAEQGLVCTDLDVEAVYSDRPGNEIVWQSLDANSEAMEGDTIRFQVSSGLAPSSAKLVVHLPQDREQVRVQVYVGDETEPQFNEPLSCADGSVTVPLTGSGVEYVKVYFDGLLSQEETQYVQFD